jgi:hypothetical protein
MVRAHVVTMMRQAADSLGLSNRQDRQPSIIAFEGFDECLRDAVGFWRTDWRETKLEAQGSCGVERVLGDVRRAVVGQPFDGMRRYLKDREAEGLKSVHFYFPNGPDASTQTTNHMVIDLAGFSAGVAAFANRCEQEAQ